MANNDSGVCSASNDFLSTFLGRVGITRSLLWTLTLIPFAWNGVVWVGQSFEALWDLVTQVVE